MFNKRNVWYKCSKCGEGSECYAFLKGLNYNCVITADCLSGDNNAVWVESAPPKSDTAEAVQQPLTQAKAAEALPEGEICPMCKQNIVPMQLSDFMGFGQDVPEDAGKLPLA